MASKGLEKIHKEAEDHGQFFKEKGGKYLEQSAFWDTSLEKKVEKKTLIVP